MTFTARFQVAPGLSLLLAFSCGYPSELTRGNDGNEGENEETQWEDEWTLLEDFEDADIFGWVATLDGEANTSASTLVENDPPRGKSLQALLLDVPEGVEASYVWHHHFSPLEQMSALRFWARSDEASPGEVLFAMTGSSGQPSTYASAQRSQQPFRVKRLALSEEWQQYTVLFDELAAEGEGEALPLYDSEGFLFHIIVPPGSAGQLWLDDIEVGCTEGAICSAQP